MKKPGRGKWKWIMLALLVVAGGSYLAIARSKKGAAGAFDKNLLAEVKRGDLEVTVLETGRVDPLAKAQVKSRVPGQVVQVTVEEGQRVKKGDLLMTLEPTDFRREVGRAEADVEAQRLAVQYGGINYDRAKKAQDGAFGPAADVDEAQFQLGQAKARLAAAQVAVAAARDRLAYTRIEAPIDGTVTQRNIQPGEVVVAGVTSTFEGKPLLVIEDLRTLIVRIELNQIDVARVTKGQKAEITLDALPGRTFSAAVTKVAPSAVARSGSNGSSTDVFPVEVTLDGAQKLDGIKPGMTADVKIFIETKQNVLTAPIEAVTTEGKKSVVHLVDKNASPPRTTERQVKLGLRNDRDVEIAEGLAVGDKLLVKASSATKDRRRN